MSQVSEIKDNATAIRDGLQKMGKNRTVALSVHVTKELIEELEERAEKLIQQVESLEG